MGAVGACVSAAAEGGASPASQQDSSGQGWVTAATQDAGAPRCPHGALEDPHRGFVRCLEPGEADAGWLPPPPQPEPPPDDAGAPPPDGGDAGPIDGGAPDAAVVSAPPPVVEIKEPEFMNGDVPNVAKRLEKVSPDLAQCVADHGGLSGASGSVKIQFLVRVRGRAEGVEILEARGVTPDAQRCIRQFLKNRAIGTPSADPVGVTVTLSLRAAK
ncbi:hypothetical protein WME76_29675 [Sorangium sp. So ce119]|uniref:hypothetical protein n=1 Tax=Sorangium sp. So ce119 TaxID=3133279 RepID=UPI003F6279A0